jgi:hypothetical protein
MSDLNIVPTALSPFDAIQHVDRNKEYWLARELMSLLGYVKWQRFSDALDRAIAACKNAQNSVSEHFLPEAVKINKGAGRPQQDYRLSRYACYLVAMNGDSRKVEIAQAQTYFAIKTREAETQQAAPPPKTQAEINLVQAQLMVDREKWEAEANQRFTSLESEVKEIKQIRIDASNELNKAALPPAKTEAPILETRRALLHVVNLYCRKELVEQQEAWNLLYEQLRLRCKFAVKKRNHLKNETHLDVVVRHGYLDKTYAIALDYFGLQGSNTASSGD